MLARLCRTSVLGDVEHGQFNALVRTEPDCECTMSGPRERTGNPPFLTETLPNRIGWLLSIESSRWIPIDGMCELDR
jgi:hypothetical protein